MQLKKSVMNKLKTNTESDYIKSIKEVFNFYEKNYMKVLTINFKKRPKNFIGQNSIVFLQTNLYKAKMLSKAYLDGLNRNNPIMSVLALRAHFETTGALALLLKKYNQYLTNTIEQKDFEDNLSSLYLGIKDNQHLPEAPNPQNAMKLIDSVDHFLKTNYDLKAKLFREGYDFLSELCHPNSYGYMLGHKIVDKGKAVKFTDENETHDIGLYQLEYFSISHDLYIQIYKEMKQLIINNEDIPYFEFQ